MNNYKFLIKNLFHTAFFVMKCQKMLKIENLKVSIRRGKKTKKKNCNKNIENFFFIILIL